MSRIEERSIAIAEKPINMLIKHCRMFLYGCSGSPELYVNEVAQDFYSFALMHLTCTMFLTKDSSKDEKGGVFHRVLDPLGKSNYLRTIDKIFAKKVGKITLETYIKERRNLLATHRTLSLQSLSVENQAIVNNQAAHRRFDTLMEDLKRAVTNLLMDLIELDMNQPN
jgi:hypothetical protein